MGYARHLGSSSLGIISFSLRVYSSSSSGVKPLVSSANSRWKPSQSKSWTRALHRNCRARSPIYGAR